MYGIVNTYLSLEDYWEFLQINECAAYGIKNFPTTGVMGLGCGDYWDQKNRVWLAFSIQKAEKRLEADRWLGFPLGRKYIGPRQLDYSFPIYLGKYVRGVGVETTTLVDTVDLTLRTLGVIDDIITFTVTVDFTDPSELVLKYPTAYFDNSCRDFSIRPSCVEIAGTTATIEVPRCRLLKPEFFKDYQDVNERPNYETDANFLDTIDIFRNYLNTTTGANLVWWSHKGSLCCNADVFCSTTVPGCSDVRQLACPYITRQRDGWVQLKPATYSDGWTVTTNAVKRCPDGVEINFMKFFYDRYEEWDTDIKRAVIAIAHNNLPQEYCSCDVQTLYHKNDTRPIEPPVKLGLGMSTWGNYEAEQIIREFDRDRNSHNAGLM